MSTVKITSLWKKLETAMTTLARSTQILLLEKFLEEVNKTGLSMGGVMIFSYNIFYTGKQEVPAIINLKSGIFNKDPKPKQVKKMNKRKIDVPINETKTGLKLKNLPCTVKGFDILYPISIIQIKRVMYNLAIRYETKEKEIFSIVVSSFCSSEMNPPARIKCEPIFF